MKHDKNTKHANRNSMNDNKNAVQIIEHIMKIYETDWNLQKSMSRP